jgi:hypothetical protein
MEPKDLENKQLSKIQEYTLLIQITAAAVGSSLLLILIPNVETITFTAFFVGYLFNKKFAYSTTFTLILTWEILASIIFSFSGITFIFKAVAWLLVTTLGIMAKRMKISSPLEFAAFGLISTLIFDILVTIPYAFFFIGQLTDFFTIILTTFIFGIYFTLLHTISNSVLFAYLPKFLDSIIPVLSLRYERFIDIKKDVIHQFTSKTYSGTGILLLNKKTRSQSIVLTLISIIIIALLITSVVQYYKADEVQDDDIIETLSISIEINFADLIANLHQELNISSTKSAFDALLLVTTVNYTDYGSLVYVDAINNVWSNQNITNHFWIYYINGQRANIAANSYIVKASDAILWSYES